MWRYFRFPDLPRPGAVLIISSHPILYFCLFHRHVFSDFIPLFSPLWWYFSNLNPLYYFLYSKFFTVRSLIVANFSYASLSVTRIPPTIPSSSLSISLLPKSSQMLLLLPSFHLQTSSFPCLPATVSSTLSSTWRFRSQMLQWVGPPKSPDSVGSSSDCHYCHPKTLNRTRGGT